MPEMNQREQPLTDPGALKVFFQECNEREQGRRIEVSSLWPGYENQVTVSRSATTASAFVRSRLTMVVAPAA